MSTFSIKQQKKPFLFLLFIQMFRVPLPNPNVIGARWFVTFIDDCTRVTWVFLLQNKSDVSTVFSKFFYMIKNQLGVSIKGLGLIMEKSTSIMFLFLFVKKRELSMSLLVLKDHNKMESQEKKWASIRLNPSTIVSSKCSQIFEGEAVLTSTYLINQLPSRVLGFKSPMDVLSSFYPNLSTSSNLKSRIFECVSFVHVHSQDRKKLDPRALRCVFVGYSSTQ